MGFHMSLKSAAEYLHMDENELRHFAQREEVASIKRGDEFLFERKILCEWAQRRVMSLTDKKLKSEHRLDMTERRKSTGNVFHVADLVIPEGIDPDLTSKTRGGVLRDMTDLAESTGLLYDPEMLFAELTAREEVASTAIGGGAAFLHAKYHDPYMIQESFIAIGRTRKPVFFGALDGTATDVFFLICCTEHQTHLHVLSRLCLLAHGTTLLEDLRTADDAETMLEILRTAENKFLDGMA
jgi:mannitol/fructose-specific phosphotransferase system IIA component (Ntr-type)